MAGTTETAGAQGNTDSAAADAAAAAATAAAEAAKGGDQGKGGDAAAAAAAAATTEAGKAGDKGAETKASTAAAAETAAKAPDKYTLAIPDDAKEIVDDVVLKSVEQLARANNWTNEEAQDAVNEHARMVKEADAAFLTQLKADADYGGEKLVETQRLSKAAIDLVRPEGHPRREAFLRAINRVAAGNHPEFVSFLADLGRRAAEDSPAANTGAANKGQKTPEEVFYGKQPAAKTT